MTTELDTLLGGGIPTPFGHREHLTATLEAIDRYGADAGELIMRGALKSAVAKVGLADKYHDTMTRFWFGLVAHVRETSGAGTVDELVAVFPAVLDKDAPFHHWSHEQMMSKRARASWLDPDLAPIPWTVDD